MINERIPASDIKAHDIDFPEVFTVFAFILATRPDDLALIRYLLDREADLNVEMCFGKYGIGTFRCCTPFFVAVKKGGLALIRLLVKKGADLQFLDHNNKNALHYAAVYNNDPEVLKFLTRQGGDMNKNSIGRTPLSEPSGRVTVPETPALRLRRTSKVGFVSVGSMSRDVNASYPSAGGRRR